MPMSIQDDACVHAWQVLIRVMKARPELLMIWIPGFCYGGMCRQDQKTICHVCLQACWCMSRKLCFNCTSGQVYAPSPFDQAPKPTLANFHPSHMCAHAGCYIQVLSICHIAPADFTRDVYTCPAMKFSALLPILNFIVENVELPDHPNSFAALPHSNTADVRAGKSCSDVYTSRR